MPFVLPKSVAITELVARDGFQHEQRFIPTEAKIWVINALTDAGYRHIEASSFANPKYVPQFKDCETVLKSIKRKPGVTYSTVNMTVRAVERACQARQEGWGPDKMVCMISTSESHNLRNAGEKHADHWPKLKEWLKMSHAAGIRFCGCVGTVFGCPIEGPVPVQRAVEFTDRFLDMGADEIEYGDTTGEGTPDRVFDFYSRMVEKYPDPNVHIAHFHESRGWALANCLAALQAGVARFESSMGGIGGQPADMIDGVPIAGTGALYTPSDITGNTRSEDLLVMLDEMGIETGIDVDKALATGRMVERIVGRRLRSYCTETGRIPKAPTGR
ncbi:MAG: hydroxymethylglutaryl-CoA lyase [Chloroflexi bacterium]|nr:hydroxymethylglutaryl-CoA lyase [Chloroflexota bacterium]